MPTLREEDSPEPQSFGSHHEVLSYCGIGVVRCVTDLAQASQKSGTGATETIGEHCKRTRCPGVSTAAVLYRHKNIT